VYYSPVLSVFAQLTVVTYIVSGVWVGMTSFCALPIILFLMLRSICLNEIQLRDYWYLDNYCLNMSRFGQSHVTTTATTTVSFIHSFSVAIDQLRAFSIVTLSGHTCGACHEDLNYRDIAWSPCDGMAFLSISL